MPIYAPDTLISSGGFSGTPVVGDIDDGVDVSDNSWLVASGNNTSTDIHVSFPTPTDPLTVGADLQKIRARIRPFDAAQTGDPDWRLELWENGAVVRAGSNTQILNDAGETIIEFTFNGNEITDTALIEAKFFGTKAGGPPGARNTIDIEAIELVTDEVAAATPHIAFGKRTNTLLRM